MGMLKSIKHSSGTCLKSNEHAVSRFTLLSLHCRTHDHDRYAVPLLFRSRPMWLDTCLQLSSIVCSKQGLESTARTANGLPAVLMTSIQVNVGRAAFHML